ncbi:hypothetical protein L1987_83018 [Smallanthus sonchifolius]|uniref:Uncharacterized protein n=1 Tax=Smallanthus sonchifolius TaxID=185202 RepID=A0ACB8YBN5_9ASTR|nr:hypothetical protein L1987_83018 [Smallanthus sonchifolius]
MHKVGPAEHNISFATGWHLDRHAKLQSAYIDDFAPNDEVMIDFSGRFPDYQPLFYRHALFTGTIVAVEAISPQQKDSKWRSLKTQHVQL